MGNSCIHFRRKLNRHKKIPEDPETVWINAYHAAHPRQFTYYSQSELQEIEIMLQLEKTDPPKSRITSKIKCSEDAVIGRGSYGEVTRGYDSANKIFMAVKRISRTLVPSNEKDMEDLNREIKLMAAIQHPNIVAYYGCKKLPKALVIYMEYVDMGSLEDMVKQYGSLPEDITAKYTEQILKGIDYLHSHSIIHRDIKTANILVDTKGVVKISDFGSARYITNYAESFKGTLSYMAPEVR